MQKILKLILVTTIGFQFTPLATTDVRAQANRAKFDYFEYKGNDSRFNRKIDPKNEYFNPIVSGFYPDPSICRKGKDYYMVHSTFSYYPGVPILHSTDLVNWTQIGFVLNRPSQLKLDGIRLSGGIYAPDIQYNKHNDTFYMITTSVDGIGNFIVKTKDPKLNDWSEPIPLPNVGGIDPSLFFDDDGKAYIIHNDAPEGTPEWNGHRAIWIHDYDTQTDKTFGERKLLLDGGVDRSKKPVWIEGPHIYKVNDKYYLMAAEGGTSVNHSEVILRSDNVKGTYVPYENNPILTQRDMAEPRPDIVTSVGHADLIETPTGEWYAVFLGCRPYEGNHYNTGRETFLLPVKWKDGFPIILEKGIPVPTVVKKKGLMPNSTNFFSGNFTWKDDFELNTLAKEWSFIRTPRGEWWQLKNGNLILEAIPRSIYDVDNPAFIGRRQQHLVFEAETEVQFIPENSHDLAGLVCYQNEAFNFVFGKTIDNNKEVLVVDRSEKERKRIAQIPIPNEYLQSPVKLRITGDNDKYSFFASFDSGKTWQTVAENIDAKNLSTQSAGGFTGVMIGMYASSANVIPALKEVYKDDFQMGVAVSMNHLAGQEAAMIKKHFNSLTAENDMKPVNLLVKGGGYNYKNADRIVRFARENNMKLRGHTLVWHNQTPEWFFLDDNDNPLDSSVLYNRMENYMTDVMTHFKDDVYCWDVVNEALSDKPDEFYRTDSPWYKACKEAYIERAFRTAHRINPNVKLFYNDYNLVQPQKREKAYQLLKRLKEAGVPVHGVGMQGHWSMQDITREDIQKSIDMFSSLGLDIHITELDLTVYTTYHGEGAKNQVKETRAWTPELAKQQADMYKMIFEVLRANKGKISSVTFWGLADNYTWLHNFPVPNRHDYPMVFDNDLNAKQSFWNIVEF